MKCNLKKLAKTDAQIYYMMRLCQAETTPQDAAHWLKKLAAFNESNPEARERIVEWETNALNDLAVVVGFIQDLSPAASMPSVSRTKGQMFVSLSQDLEAEVVQLKGQVDLLDFALPIDNLLEPGMSEGALKKLDQFVIDKLGTKLGFLYEDLVNECLAVLEKQYQLAKSENLVKECLAFLENQYQLGKANAEKQAKAEEQAKTEEQSKAPEQAKAPAVHQQQKIDWAPIPVPAPQPREERIEQRGRKEKIRPAHSSVYELTPTTAALPDTEESAPSLKVKASAAEVFSTMFDKTRSRGAVDWVDFVAAMVDLGFSVLPKFGSVYMFFPPESMSVKRSITVHRPHKSEIEEYKLLILSRNLKRVYGWGDKTFVAA